MYGSLEGDVDDMALIADNNERHELRKPRANKTFFDGPFEQEFWTKVREFYCDGAMHWADALNEAHYLRLQEEAAAHDKDPAVYMMVDCVNEFWNLERSKEYLDEIFPSFEKEVSRIMRIVLDKDAAACELASEKGEEAESKYSEKLPADDKGVKKTLLHIAAEQNLAEVAKMVLEKFNGLQYVHTRGGGTKVLPIECALGAKDGKDRDAVSALIIESMLNERVRELFHWDDVFEKKPKYNFVALVQRKNTRKTVVAVLNAMINPDWPFILMDEDDAVVQEKAWQTDPTLPIRYHFFYECLDQDEQGHPPKKREGDHETVLVYNPAFNHRSKSGLAALSQGPHKDFAVKHPVVRVLTQRKWDTYGKKIVRIHTVFYVLFLILLSFAFVAAGHAKDPLVYKGPFDFLRAICEGGSLLFGVVYLLDEFDQMEKERVRYWKDYFNWFDLAGLILLFCCVPLRILNLSGQWITAAIAFMVNFLRIFKFFCAWEEVGLYAKTLAAMFKKDLRVFGFVYTIVLCAFSGGLYLTFRGVGQLNKVSGFGDIVLRGVRSLVEGKEFADDYSGLNIFLLLLILFNMLVIIVFLMNILIAQLSSRYEAAMQEAAVQYDIDKIGMVTRVENSRFQFLNRRRTHYVDGDYVNDIAKISDLISVWNDTLRTYGLEDKEQMLEDAKKLWTKSKAVTNNA